jgi:hypothetical protein
MFHGEEHMKWLKSGCFCPLFLGVLSLIWGVAAYGQASATAEKTAGISVFGGGSLDKPDYGLAAQPAYDFGLDFTWFLRHSYLTP